VECNVEGCLESGRLPKDLSPCVVKGCLSPLECTPLGESRYQRVLEECTLLSSESIDYFTCYLLSLSPPIGDSPCSA
jgi:hypothetical protein